MQNQAGVLTDDGRRRQQTYDAESEFWYFWFHRIRNVFLLLGEEWEELSDFLFRRLAAIFADFECLSVLDSFSSGRAESLCQLVAILIRDAGVSGAMKFFGPRAPAGRILRNACELLLPGLGIHTIDRFINLGSESIHGADLLLKYLVDGDDDVRPERIWFLKTI